jgi:hypothetical protein
MYIFHLFLFFPLSSSSLLLLQPLKSTIRSV